MPRSTYEVYTENANSLKHEDTLVELNKTIIKINPFTCSTVDFLLWLEYTTVEQLERFGSDYYKGTYRNNYFYYKDAE